MKDYTIVYKKGDSIHYTCPDKHSLIKELFDGDEELFKSEVVRLMWDSVSTQYIEDIQNGKGYAEINSADVNPYGWRNT